MPVSAKQQNLRFALGIKGVKSIEDVMRVQQQTGLPPD